MEDKKTKTKPETQDKAQEIHDKQLEVLDRQLKALTKPDTQAEFLARQAAYDAKKEQREALKQEIDQRRMEIMRKFDWLKVDEATIIEANLRRAKQIEEQYPDDANKLYLNAKVKIEQTCPAGNFKVNIKTV